MDRRGVRTAIFAEDGPLSAKAFFTCSNWKKVSAAALLPTTLPSQTLPSSILRNSRCDNMEMDEQVVAVEEPRTADTQMQDAPAEPQHTDVNSKKRPREDEDDDEGPRPAEKKNDADAEPLDDGDDHDAKKEDTTASQNPAQPTLSKNQLRKQKRQKLRDERKVERKLLRKDQRHEKTARRRLERDEQAEVLAKTLGIDKAAALRKIAADEASKNTKAVVQSRPVPVAFVIDCDFEKYMRDNELVSLAGQVTRGYSMNRNGRYQAHYVVSSWGGKLKERFDGPMRGTHVNWKGVSFVEGDFIEAGRTAWEAMHGKRGGRTCPALEGQKGDNEQKPEKDPSGKTTDQAHSEAQQPSQDSTTDGKPAEPKAQDPIQESIPNGKLADAGAQDSTKGTTAINQPAALDFSPDSIVYLSADSPHILDKLEPYTSYVIGGLVDRNREKNLCQRRAEGKGIRTAKLPIGEYMQMADRKVLATNHVVEIMSKWLESGDWGKAFMEVIPKRKGGRLKGEEGDEEVNEGDDEVGNVDGACVEEEKAGSSGQDAEALAAGAEAMLA